MSVAENRRRRAAVGMVRRYLVCVAIVGAFGAGAALADATESAEEDPSVQADDEIGFNLARLAALEQELGNGGADEGAAVYAGYDKKNGFHIRDAEDNFRLRFIGRLQGRYTYKAMDTRGGSGTGRDTSGFELERARIGLRGHLFSPRLTFKIEIDSDTDSGDKGNLKDGYIVFKEALGEGNEHLNLGIGQWKPGFLRQEKTSSGKQQFVDRSLMNEFFSIDRNIGIWASGACDRFEYEVALTNGFDSVSEGLSEIDHSPAIILRGDFNILRAGDKNMKMSESDTAMTESPAWVVGAAFATDANNNTAADDQDEFKVYQFEIDTAYKYMGFSLQAEYALRWLNYDPGDPGDILDPGDNTVFAHGFYIQGGYFILPEHGVEVAARTSVVWSDGAPGNSKAAAVEIGPAVNWFISKDHRVKLQVDAAYVDIPAAMQPPSERLVSDGRRSLSSGSTNLAAGDQGIITRAQIQFSW